GATRPTASMTALDSLMRTSLTGSASPGDSATTPVGAAGSSIMLVTATADRAPDTIPATTAMATMAGAPGPRRTVTRCGGDGGRLDQAGATCQPSPCRSRPAVGPREAGP